jgi:hypothetical protein
LALAGLLLGTGDGCGGRTLAELDDGAGDGCSGSMPVTLAELYDRAGDVSSCCSPAMLDTPDGTERAVDHVPAAVPLLSVAEMMFADVADAAEERAGWPANEASLFADEPCASL